MPPKIERVKKEDIITPNIDEPQTSSVFSSVPDTVIKKSRKSSPKSNVATVGTDSTDTTDSTDIKKPLKSSPKSNLGKDSVLKSSASDSSSDVGSLNLSSSNKGTWGTASSSGTPEPVESDIDEEIEQWQYKNILTPYNKSQDKFQERLANLTRSDAHHDLKKVFNETAYKNINIKKAFDSGIPKAAVKSFHEGEAFASIIISATDSNGNVIQINENEDKLSEALSAVPNCTDGNTGAYSTFEVGVPDMSIFKFKVVQFIIKCSNNSEFKNPNFNLVELSCKSDFGQRFVDNVKLGEDSREAAIIVDFSQHGFIEDLTTGAESDFEVHYLLTPEVVNDPAGKPNVNNKALFGLKKTGVKLISYVEETDNVTAYTKFDEKDPNTTNNFFSNYDFTLSPIKKITTKQKAEKLITNLLIKYDIGTETFTDPVNDSKGENSINTVLSYLKNLMEQVKVNFDIATIFNFNSKIQQKRGGDWFQALSCIDAKNRYITQILPTPSEPTKLNSNCPVYLVTHDRIAVSFALLNGVNVIYLDYYGRIFVFKNSSDKTLKGSGKSMEQILFDGIKEKWMSDNEQSRNTFFRMIDTANKYSIDRNEYLFRGRGREATGGSTGKINDFYSKCDAIRKKLDEFDFSDKNAKKIVAFQKMCTQKLQNLFTAAVELTFIKINLINVENDIKIVEAGINGGLFKGEYSDDIKNNVANFSRALNNVKSIQDKFGIIPDSSDFYTAFDNWIIGNITKLDVYKCAKKVLSDMPSGDENVRFDFNRIISFFTKDHLQERKTDANIFLPFIQDIEYTDRETECKNKMLSILSVLVPKIESYIELVKANLPSRVSKEEKLHPNELYFNNLSNLIYESYIFIDNTKSIASLNSSSLDTSAASSSSSSSSAASSSASASEEAYKVQELIEYSKSTDNILLRVDKEELDLMKGAGKYSNYTGLDAAENVKEDIQGNIEITDETVSKVYNLKCIVKGNSINCNGTAEEGDKLGGEQAGGGYIDAYQNPNKPGQTIKVESVICDISLKQIIWPLITTNLIEKTEIGSLIQFSQQIRSYITGLDKPENTDLFNLVQTKIQNYSSTFNLQSESVKSAVVDTKTLADGLQKQIQSKGGAIGDLPTVSKDLMTDFKLGFHPLTPIYALLSSYYNIIGEKSQTDPFFYTYFTYVNVLEKMKKVLEENYLSNTINSPKTASAYMIGFGLYFMLFASHTSLAQNNEILSVLNMDQKEYSEFSLKNDGLVSVFSGSIRQTPEDEAIGMVLVNNELFNNFINNEVNIKQIMEQGTPVQNLPSYDVLQDRMFNLMGEIVVKVNADRGTPVSAALGPSGLASGISGLSVDEQAARVARLEEQQKKLEENVAKEIVPRKTGLQDTSKLFAQSEGDQGDQSNMVTVGRRSTGGKRSKRYINKKRKVTKKRKANKLYKNKTLKKARIYRKTRKH